MSFSDALAAFGAAIDSEITARTGVAGSQVPAPPAPNPVTVVLPAGVASPPGAVPIAVPPGIVAPGATVVALPPSVPMPPQAQPITLPASVVIPTLNNLPAPSPAGLPGSPVNPTAGTAGTLPATESATAARADLQAIAERLQTAPATQDVALSLGNRIVLALNNLPQ